MVAARKMTSMEGELASEFDFSMQDFERVRQLIHARAGIALSSNKQQLILWPTRTSVARAGIVTVPRLP